MFVLPQNNVTTSLVFSHFLNDAKGMNLTQRRSMWEREGKKKGKSEKWKVKREKRNGKWNGSGGKGKKRRGNFWLSANLLKIGQFFEFGL